MPGQVVDAAVAEEFMRETLEKVTPETLIEIANELAVKSGVFAERLDASRLQQPDRDDLHSILRLTFCSRRKADAILDEVGVETLAGEIYHLLYSTDPLPFRFERLQSALAEFPQAAFELPSEILHFTQPERYWLWTRWMWDSRPETGALALVTDDEFDFGDDPPGSTYLRVGQAVAFVSETGSAAGFSAIDDSPFSVDVFLACVYSVYMYTVLRLRMTQEFNSIVPQQDELVRRLLGVHRMEV